MVVILLSRQGANTKLSRYDGSLKTHESTQPKPTSEDIDRFRQSPSTHLRFGFASAVEARVRGLGGKA